MSRTRIMPTLRQMSRSGFPARLCRLQKTCVRHARWKLRHDGAPLGAVHARPARDLRQRASAAEAEVGSGVDLADCGARRVLAHSCIVEDMSALAQAPW